MSLFWLAWSYFRHRFLLTLSAVGIGLGVAVVFAVLAVLNGFLQEFENTLREFSGDVVVRPGPSASLEKELSVITSVPGVSSASPRLNWFALVGRRGTRAVSDPRSSDLSGLLLVGIDPGTEGRSLAGSLSEEELSRMLEEPSGGSAPPPILLGAQAAKKLGLERGHSLETITFLSQRGGQAYAARKTFRVAGTFKTGQYSQDLDRALVRRSDLEAFTRHPSGATQIVVRIRSDQQPGLVAGKIREALGAARLDRDGALPQRVSTWREQGGNLLAAVENQRGILATVFFFIVIVALYQLIATLTLTVTEKRRDVGVLRALGATRGRILGFFVSLALVIAGVGVSLGLLLGWWLTGHLETVERWLGGGQPIFKPEIYQFDRIPVLVDPASVWLLILATLGAAVFFSLLPALRAARLPVVRSLRASA